MKIVCKVYKRDVLIREMDIGGALVGHRITEVRLGKKDLAILVARLTSDSSVIREHTLEYLKRLQTKFPPTED